MPKEDFHASEQALMIFFSNLSLWKAPNSSERITRYSVGYRFCNCSISMQKVNLARLIHIPSRTPSSAWLWKMKAHAPTSKGREEKYFMVKMHWTYTFIRFFPSLSEFATKFSPLTSEIMNSWRGWMMKLVAPTSDSTENPVTCCPDH